MTRVFVTVSCRPGVEINLESDDAHHLSQVLRMKPGDEIIVVSDGNPWRSALTAVSAREARAKILAAHEADRRGELPVAVTVLQAVPKGTKMDDVIEKVVELGAARIQPIRCARSYGGDNQAKLERWRRIAKSAARQSQRLIIPEVDEPLEFNAALARAAAASTTLVAYEGARAHSLADALAPSDDRALSLVIGPEGSFTEDELRLAREAGGALVSLGPTVLRTETAAAAMLSAVAALRGWW
ncbi:MAG: 16S rRNA (uracil(1498)-N(3))-methyltransferase [Candidatus Eremiobacteraeota bacterium]|nr:16S rRNA (uracil(1498)-N(3))-methyltransferase [Candidatus Eremiobacteraeota bacterium]